MNFKRTLCAIGLASALALCSAGTANATSGVPADTDTAIKDAAYAALMETHAEGDSGHYVFLYAWNSNTRTVSAGEVARNRVGYYTSQPAEGVRKALKNGVML